MPHLLAGTYDGGLYIVTIKVSKTQSISIAHRHQIWSTHSPIVHIQFTDPDQCAVITGASTEEKSNAFCFSLKNHTINKTIYTNENEENEDHGRFISIHLNFIATGQIGNKSEIIILKNQEIYWKFTPYRKGHIDDCIFPNNDCHLKRKRLLKMGLSVSPFGEFKLWDLDRKTCANVFNLLEKTKLGHLVKKSSKFPSKIAQFNDELFTCIWYNSNIFTWIDWENLDLSILMDFSDPNFKFFKLISGDNYENDMTMILSKLNILRPKIKFCIAKDNLIYLVFEGVFRQSGQICQVLTCFNIIDGLVNFEFYAIAKEGVKLVNNIVDLNGVFFISTNGHLYQVIGEEECRQLNLVNDEESCIIPGERITSIGGM